MLLNLYSYYKNTLNKSQNLFLLLIRVYWGWLFFRAGFWKFTHHQQTTAFFNHLGLPFPEYFVFFIAFVETFGGIFLFLGIFSRLTALILTFNMIGAFIVGERKSLFSIFSNPEDFYMAQPTTFLLSALIILFFGSGKFSIDNLISKYSIPKEDLS